MNDLGLGPLEWLGATGCGCLAVVINLAFLAASVAVVVLVLRFMHVI